MNKTFFLHIRQLVYYKKEFLEIYPRGGATIAYQTGTVNFNGIDSVVVRGAVSICHPLDNFNKHTGRVNSQAALLAQEPRSNRTFMAHVGYLADLQTRVVNGCLEVMHDNEMMHKLLADHAFKIIRENCGTLFVGAYNPDSEIKMELR